MIKLGRQGIHTVFVAILSLFASLYFFRSNLNIELGPIDDHEIVRFLGSDKQLWIWQIPKVLFEDTEVGSYGEGTRFRPTYYFFRLLETSAFGVDATHWYFSRIIMVALVCFFLTAGLTKLIALKNYVVIPFLSASLIFSICSLTSWQDIVSRLGPSEIYLALGLSMFFYLSTLLALDNFSKKTWLTLCITYVLTLGTKENGIFLSLPFLLLGITVFHKSTKKFFIATTFGVSILFTFLISAGWLLGMKSAGGDVYGNARTVEAAQYQILQSLVSLRHSKEFGFAVFTVVLYFVVSWLKTKKWHRSFWYMIALQGTLHFMIISEKIFYNSGINNLRYAVITQIASLLLIAVSIILILNVIHLLFGTPRYLLTSIIILVFSLLLLRETVPATQLAKSNFDLVAKNARLGGEYFQGLISKTVQDISTTKYDSIVIQISYVWDYEPAYALSQYLEFYGGDLPKYLNIIPFSVAPGIETSLLAGLTNTAKNGSSSWNIEPNKSLIPENKNYCITLNNAPKDTTICDN
jgi:hypothetical protein